MSIINLLKTSLYSLKAHKLRVFLTMIGIIIGISSVTTILSIANGFKIEIKKSMAETKANKIKIGFTADNKITDISLIQPFTKNDIANIKKVDGVEKVEVSKISGELVTTTVGATYFDRNSAVLVEDYENKMINVKYGRSFNKGDASKKLLVLTNEAAVSLFDSPENAIGHGVEISGYNYMVIGILEQTNKFSIMGNSSYISNYTPSDVNENKPIDGLDVYIEPGSNKDKTFEDAKRMLMQYHPNLKGSYKLQEPEGMTKAFDKIIGGLTAFLAFITGISLFVGGIGVMNIMYVSVSERKREIGIRRAIGAKPKSILLQFLFEATIVTGAGGLIGILLGYFIGKVAGKFLPFPPVLTVASFLGATLTSVLVGIIFGIIPAINASKLDPIKAIYK
ncbi:putative ABC transport system permease protein [Clostridium amylolyticum]|uniref:Putative ABC transport system permease protein n=1 Tax=Clostridium amylolyticum TaxID=1121298 RepID=A0A1M6BJE5_9CLOT|nr:FtsX-like permease family protein [Clostridium amylolyticum]SHI48816.1 putative ABC transport system permease protein [Clostridium amylolyticum]